MDYESLLRRSLRLIRSHPFLFVPGLIIGTLSGEGLPRFLSNRFLFRRLRFVLEPLAEVGTLSVPSLPPRTTWEPILQLYRLAAPLGIPGWIGLTALLLLVLIALGVLVIVARGGLIAAAAAIDAGGTPGLGGALRAGWRKAWRLIIIASIPPIPITVAAILVTLLALFTVQRAGGIEAIQSVGPSWVQVRAGLILAATCLIVPLGVVTWALGLLRHLADRACVLDNARVLDAYQRAWTVFRQNLKPVVFLLLVQIALDAVLSLILFVPRLVMAVCALAAPIVWVVGGIARTYFITLWTLAWQLWVEPLHAASLPDEG